MSVKVRTLDGTPVEVGVMDKDGRFLDYQFSPEDGFYVFEGNGMSATVVLTEAKE